MGKRERQKAKLDRDEVSEEERELTNQNPSKSAAEQSSSDDDEANEDISLRIVEKALLMRAAKLAPDKNAAVLGEPSGGLVELPSSSSSQEAEVAAADLETKKVRRKERKKNIKKMKIEDQAVSDFRLLLCLFLGKLDCLRYSIIFLIGINLNYFHYSILLIVIREIMGLNWRV